MTRLRPCIDLHAGQVKQIVGGTLYTSADPVTNHVSSHSAKYFADLYRQYNMTGAHIIMLGPGNEDAAEEALNAWPGALQVGGGITAYNAGSWIEKGAGKVIVTSYLFPNARFNILYLLAVLQSLGGKTERLVIDLSCRRQETEGTVEWVVAMDKWQTLTDTKVDAETIRMLEPHCAEFLVHAADVEGLQRGIDEELVARLGEWCTLPVTYAGGGKSIDDLERVRELSHGKVDLTIGSAMDIFGGTGVKFDDCVAWNKRQDQENPPPSKDEPAYDWS